MLLNDGEIRAEIRKVREELDAKIEAKMIVLNAERDALQKTNDRLSKENEEMLEDIADLRTENKEMAKSAYMSELGQRSVRSRQETAEQTEQAIAEAMMLLQKGTAPADVLKQLGPKYPQLAARLAKKHLFG